MTLTIIFAAAFLITLVLLVRSLFRQAGVQDAIKQTADHAAGQLQLWEEFGEHLDEGVALVSPDGMIQYVNRTFADLTGWTGRSARSQQLEAVLHVTDGSKALTLEERKRKGVVLSRDGSTTSVYGFRRKLRQPAGYEVIILVDATAEDAEKALRHRLVNLSSFELRAPITAMKGYADLLLDDGKLSKDAESKVRTIMESADKLLRIIEDMAQVQTLSESKPAAAKERIKLTALADSLVEPLRRVAKESGRGFELEPLTSDSEIEVTASDIGRLLGIVTNTAARTANPKSTVILHLEEGDREISFRIENEGPPLARDQQNNVFDYVGAQGFEEGIGYYLAQQIISAHQARFAVTQTKAGNAFALSLPRPAAAKPVKKTGKAGKKLDIGK